MLLTRRRRLTPFGVRRRLRLLPIESHLTPSPSLHSGAHAWLPTSQSSASAPFNPKSAPPPHDNPITVAFTRAGGPLRLPSTRSYSHARGLDDCNRYVLRRRLAPRVSRELVD